MRLRGGAVRVVGLLLVATACGPVAHPTPEELDALPGLITQDACTPDEALAVRTWFDDHLSRLGWGRDPGVWQADGLGEASWSKGAQPPRGCVTRMGTRLS